MFASVFHFDMDINNFYNLDTFDFEKKDYSKNKIKCVLQINERDCGIACLSTVTSILGNYIPLEYLRNVLTVGPNGISGDEIVKASARLNILSSAIRINEIEDLDSLRLPAIVVMEAVNSDGTLPDHYVVIYKVRNNKIQIADPAMGLRWVEKEPFYRSLKKIAILFNETDAFLSIEHKISSPQRYFFEKVKPYIKYLTLPILTSILITSLDISLPIFFGRLIDQSLASNADHMSRQMATIASISIVVLFIRYQKSKSTLKLSTFLTFKLTTDLKQKIFKLPFYRYTSYTLGDLLTRAASMSQLDSFVTQYISGFFAQILSLLGHLGVLFYIHYKFGILAIVFACIVVASIYISTEIIKSKFYEIQNLGAGVASRLVQNFSYIKVIHVLGRELQFLKRWSGKYKELQKFTTTMGLYFLKFETYSDTISILSRLLFMAVGASLISDKEVTVGGLITAISVLPSFIDPIKYVAGIIRQWAETKVVLDRVKDVELNADETAKNTHCESRDFTIDKIEFKNVTFKYEKYSENPTIKDATFSVKRGECLALIGPSGGGKTTLLNLVPGLYDPLSGEILINDQPLKSYFKKEYLSNIAYVEQQPIIFNDTVQFNVTLENNLEFVEQFEKMEDACKKTMCFDFIQNLRNGFGTIISDNNVELSGGQKQRIILARAIYSNSSLYLFDEPTSSVDKRTEGIIVNLIKDLKKDKIVIISSHNEKVLEAADRVAIVSGGEIKMIDTVEAVKSSLLYSELFGGSHE